MKKGFTLMEMLAVVLILAVIGAFAVPAVRAVRAELQHRRAKVAFNLLRQAAFQYHERTGNFPYDNFDPTLAVFQEKMMDTQCTDPAATGIPYNRRNTKSTGENQTINELFACGYLNPKDFKGIPYKFHFEYFDYHNGKWKRTLQLEGTPAAGKKYKDYKSGRITLEENS